MNDSCNEARESVITAGKPRSVCVIVPAFKAARCIRQTVLSVVDEPEVEEVLIVEDGSPDDTLEICQNLQKRHSRVKVLQHPEGNNRGAAESRNLGIDRARSPYISFLDADDLALANRFAHPLALLEARPEIDGVYEAVAMIESEVPIIDLTEIGDPPLLTFSKPVAPEFFLEAFLTPGAGTVHTNGFLVRRSVFDRVGAFRKEFEPAEDMHLFWRFAAACAMLPGRLKEPVAIYRRHAGSLSVEADPVYLEDPFRRALDLCAWARGRDDVSARNRELLKRILVHNIAAWWGEPISRSKLRRIQVRRLFDAARVVPSVLMAPKILSGALGLKKDPEVTRDPQWKRDS